MKLSRIGRVSMAFVVSVAMGLGMTACGGGTIGFMWVLGTQYNQIAGFKIDDFTGNLTTVPHSPFTSGGSNPVAITVKQGGRYVYVINKGGGDAPAGGSLPCGTGGGITEFSVGGDGVLTFQQCFTSSGSTPIWGTTDASGTYLYVLDQVAPHAVCPGPASTCFGDITVFTMDPNTGRLTLVLNQQIKDPVTQQQISYFPVGAVPTMLRIAGTCMLTVDSGDQTIFPYGIGANGQLTQTTNSTITTGATRLTSISASGSNVYLTDAGAPNSPGFILPYTVGPTCGLNTVTGSPVANLPNTSNPVYSITDSKGRWLYVLNQSSTNTTVPSSSISGFNILPNGQLQQFTDTINNPYSVGGAPVCIVEDPTAQYFYTSNGDGTVTGKSVDTSGNLSDLSRGATFTATGQATCLAISPNVT
jgi:hypothetical protein